MAKAPTPMTLSQFYEKFGSKAFEAFNRQKNGKYNPFSKIILKEDSYEIQKAIKDGIKNLSKNVAPTKLHSPTKLGSNVGE